MNRRSHLMQLASFALLSGAIATDASAAAQRTFVASFGVDNLSCSLASPCRGFAAAIAQTLPAGEVIVLDSAGYGPVTISQAVSIIAPPGVYAGISVFGAPSVGVTITAGVGKVTLRGVTINAQAGATTGIQINSADTVYIDQVAVSGFPNGLVVNAAASTTVNVQRCAFRDNGTAASFTSSAGTLSVAVEGSVFERSTVAGASFLSRTAGAIIGSVFNGGGAGISLNPAAGTSRVEIRESNINDNTGNGVFAGGSGATASVVSSVVSGNNIGLTASGAGNQVYVSDTTITRNATGVSPVASGTVVSGGDNRLVNNTAPGAFSSTVGKL